MNDPHSNNNFMNRVLRGERPDPPTTSDANDDTAPGASRQPTMNDAIRAATGRQIAEPVQKEDE